MRDRTAGESSIIAAQEAIIEEMSGLGDTLAGYEYLVSVGRGLQVDRERVRQDANLVAGCQTRVWISAEVRDGILNIAADSDAMINRGLIALLIRVLDGHSPGEILDSDLFFLDRTGLATHLSPARGNGLAAMVQRIRELAAAGLPERRNAGERGPLSGHAPAYG